MEKMWEDYLADRSVANRNALVNANMPLVLSIAATFDKQWFNDIVQAGAIGLIHAVERFTPHRGKFSTYATHIVRFRMLDCIREATDSVAEQLTVHDDIATRSEVGEDTPEETIVSMCKGCGLSKNERAVVVMSYGKHMTLKEIGKAMGFTESRASQVRSSAIKKMRATNQPAPA